ncbi:MAG TPA: carbamoyl-phosphate synthase large subunit [Acidimicrobiia bacterium]|nr:carbamoyl-phosphate synthase large subunit [Acidimicrobiia bacterium]
MPKRTDIESILVIGSGPIVIGQACEFDYSGTQACRVLKAEGYRVVLVNSNPATIMTDPDVADATYIEPLDIAHLEAIIALERPDALLPTLGGQTALNLGLGLADQGILEKYGVEMIGANPDAIRTAEDRELFKNAMTEIGLATCRSTIVNNVSDALEAADAIGYPIMIRPSFIMGGGGTGIAYDKAQMTDFARIGIEASPIGEILVEQSVLGWKEFELEVVRDKNDNCVVICSIENLDAMGVHTGDSITIAPQMTLTDVEYQTMRDASFKVLRRIGVDTGGSNVQFAVDPATGKQIVIEMNPRVSRSSALASKATGFPIAKIAARLAVGYTLDEITNDITQRTLACFEPSIDYVVTKIPRFAFEKLPGASSELGTQMQSVGEVMAIGRTFRESLQKALRSMENGRFGLNCDVQESITDSLSEDEKVDLLTSPNPERLFVLESALRSFMNPARAHELTHIDPFFINQIMQIIETREVLEARTSSTISRTELRRVLRDGFSAEQIAYAWNCSLDEVLNTISTHNLEKTYSVVDTCAGEFSSYTPYYYSTYADEDELHLPGKPTVVILGSGPNRIGQGVEFDYCCVHASYALREMGYASVMINCNPETVSTDYDTSDMLFFEPLTASDVLAICARLHPLGIIVSLGGQTPLKLARTLEDHGYKVLGTSPDSIDLAEDRDRFHSLCDELAIAQPPGGVAVDVDEALQIAEGIGYPALVRPSYVLGGRAMQIVDDPAQLREAMEELGAMGSLGREGGLSMERPALIDRFLEEAIEVDVDALRDVKGNFMIGGIMEHIEEAGVHSGDSACALPPQTLSDATVATIEEATRALAERLDVVGLINIQFAVQDESVFIIEANPRASRTVPFVAKATGIPLAKIATRMMMGETIERMCEEGIIDRARDYRSSGRVAVKEAVLPFARFPMVDAVLGPEMRSTGEVMGSAATFGAAFYKSQLGAGMVIPESGVVFISVADRDKERAIDVARQYHHLGFRFAATTGTAQALVQNGIPVDHVIAKVGDAVGDDVIDLMSSGKIDFVINTPRGRSTRRDGQHIRVAATKYRIPCVTTIAAAKALGAGIAQWRDVEVEVLSLQNLYANTQLVLNNKGA